MCIKQYYQTVREGLEGGDWRGVKQGLREGEWNHMERGEGAEKAGVNETAASARRCGANEATRHPNSTNPKRRIESILNWQVGTHQLVQYSSFGTRCSSIQSKSNRRIEGIHQVEGDMGIDPSERAARPARGFLTEERRIVSPDGSAALPNNTPVEEEEVAAARRRWKWQRMRRQGVEFFYFTQPAADVMVGPRVGDTTTGNILSRSLNFLSAYRGKEDKYLFEEWKRKRTNNSNQRWMEAVLVWKKGNKGQFHPFHPFMKNRKTKISFKRTSI